jgi:hypothetical protein
VPAVAAEALRAAAGPASSAADRALLARFEDGSIGREEFTHLAHVRVAWTLLGEAPLTQALARYSAALQRLAAGFGVPQLYSETVTVFYMVVIHQRRRAAPASGFDVFRAANADLFEPVPRFVGACYPPGALDDPANKAQFRLPLRWPA